MRAAFLAFLVFASSVGAQSFPTKPIRVIVPSPPGDGSDVVARLMGEKLAGAWGQQVVVDNRPGAGGRIGTEAAAKAPADGYTWIMGNAGSHGINGGLYRNLPYDLEKDFAPITQIMRSPNVLVVAPSLGVSSVAEFIALLKKHPGKYSYGSGGNGSSAHLSAELFKSMAGVEILHVPYKGATLALTDLIAGNIVMFMGNLPPALGHIKAGRIKALAVTTASRSKFVPELPTMDEAGLKGFETVAWFGLLARGHARGGRCQDPRRGGEHHHDPGAACAHRFARRRAGGQHAAGIRRHHPRRHREMAQGGRSGGHQGRLEKSYLQ
jgi:tripartite-type tricarboxylate transporter receptor subunit TctC